MKQGIKSSPKSKYNEGLAVSYSELKHDRKTTKSVTGFPGKPALPASLKENFDSYQKTHTILRKDSKISL